MLSLVRAAAFLAALPAAAIALVPAVAGAQTIADASPGVAGAQSPSDGAVSVTLVGGDDPALRDSLRELLARLHLAIVGPASAQPLVARVEIDLSSSSDAQFVVTDGATNQVRLRRSMPRDASSAILREEIAHAVQSAVEAALLAARDRAAAASVAPPSPSSTPTAAPAAPAEPVVVLPPPPSRVMERMEQPASSLGASRSAPYGLELMTLAGVGPIASDSGADTRIGLGAVGLSHGFLRPSIALSFLYAVPFDTGDVVLSSHTTIVSVRALAGVGLLRAKWIAVDLAAGGGIDEVTVAPHSSDLPPGDLYPQTSRTDALLSAMATAHLAVAPGVVFLVSAGVDVDLQSREYVLNQGTTDTDVLSPWRVRPMVLGGIGFTALGDGHFTSGGAR